MNPIIEKVARAICYASGETQNSEGLYEYFRWQDYIPEAKAAIEAMVEPTEEMISAMSLNGAEGDDEQLKSDYRAAIKEALKDE